MNYFQRWTTYSAYNSIVCPRNKTYWTYYPDMYIQRTYLNSHPIMVGQSSTTRRVCISRVSNTKCKQGGACWNGSTDPSQYAADPVEDIRQQGYVLLPGRYVWAAEVEDDDEPFEEKIKLLMMELDTQFIESEKLEKQIRINFSRLDFRWKN
jgi:hypothetical protein